MGTPTLNLKINKYFLFPPYGECFIHITQYNRDDIYKSQAKHYRQQEHVMSKKKKKKKKKDFMQKQRIQMYNIHVYIYIHKHIYSHTGYKVHLLYQGNL